MEDTETGFFGTEGSHKRGESGLDSARGGIVTARGTGDGLVLRLDGRVDGSSLKEAALDFLNSRKGFLSNNQVALEWVGVIPPKIFVDELSALLSAEFHIEVKSSTLWEQPSRSIPAPEDLSSAKSTSSRAALGGLGKDIGTRRSISSATARTIKPVSAGRAPSLFDGIEVFSEAIEEEIFADEVPSQAKPSQDRASMGFDSSLWDDPDARVIYATLRSGQKIETEHTLVVFGDVNSGAELIAGGDIVVLGNLRGIAHAGAYDETGGGRVIFALNLQPTQLRIGMTISRGSTDSGAVPEVARVDGNLIVVEPYSSRGNWGRRR